MYGPANTPVTNAKQKDKKILDFPNLQAKAFLFEFFLFSSIEVFHSRFRVFCFVWSYDHDKIDVLFVRVFELLVELIRSIVKIYFDVCIAQIFYHAQIFFLKIFLEVAHQYVRNQIVFYEFEFFQCRKEPVNANRTAHRRYRLSRKHPHQIVIPPATGNRAILRRIRQDNFKNRASIIIKPARQTKINAEIFYPPIEKNFYELGQLTRALVIHKLFLNIIRSLKAKVQNLKQFFSLLSSKAQKRKIFPDLFLAAFIKLINRPNSFHDFAFSEAHIFQNGVEQLAVVQPDYKFREIQLSQCGRQSRDHLGISNNQLLHNHINFPLV